MSPGHGFSKSNHSGSWMGNVSEHFDLCPPASVVHFSFHVSLSLFLWGLSTLELLLKANFFF